MARHDYKFRPKPRWEDGYFIPPAPIPVPKHPEDWSFRENIDSIFAMSSNPIATTTEATMTLEDVHIDSLGQEMIVASSPEAIRYVFVENADNYRLHPIRQALLKSILKDGLVTAEGAEWKFARRALAPIFVPRHTRGFADSMARMTTEKLDVIFPDKTHIDISDAFMKLTYYVLSETLFSGEIDGQTEQMLHDISTFLSTMAKADPLDILMAPKWLPRLTRLGGRNAMRRLRRQVRALAENRRARILADTEVPDDFLTLLLRTETEDGETLSDSQIEDHIITFIGAGHETTSRALTWLSYLLSQDTDARARLETELDALDMTQPPEDWATHMPFSVACFEESMRLYPPAPIISRQAIEADEVCGKALSKDASVLINLWSLHRHREHWDHPDAFMPNRFLPEARHRIDRFGYLPFGVGHRVCIGQRFALQEAAIIIAVVFRRLRLNWIDGTSHPWPKMRITVRPEKPLIMVVEQRG